ncbi:hypothetical protein H2248_001740 [Termitomyces sp. 'cryptogamus']|nr:hypothetical protein H2248_001740 [Termitomyces sp. 'cryptogamus']
MSNNFDFDSTFPTCSPMAVPLACLPSITSGTPPVSGTGPGQTLHLDANWHSILQQMQLTIFAVKSQLAALEEGHSVTAAQTAPQHNIPLAIPLAWDLPPMDSKTPHYKCNLELSSSLVVHVIGHQRWGLKQAHDLFSAWGMAFTTGEALIVFGNHIAMQHVYTLWKQCSGKTVLALAQPAPSQDPTLSTPQYSTQQPQPPFSTLSTAIASSITVMFTAATPSTQSRPTPWAAGSPMATGTLITIMPTSLAPGFPMDTSSLMTLSTPVLDLSALIISYTLRLYSQGTLAPHSTNTAQHSHPQ